MKQHAHAAFWHVVTKHVGEHEANTWIKEAAQDSAWLKNGETQDEPSTMEERIRAAAYTTRETP